ncbi:MULTISPECIES: copper resistance CopC family protein [unclassified Microbacterium]|uniref:copper resistance CopC family protein n=1 Tax=unclassified Microbacterium TaxID=2609290 RepID=UPI000EAA0F32|nr:MULTISPECIES: copper resistance CopC family protein [unclassified Microbacterium]MBT2485039.1 copper resistance protein CopC [Microbacterium sp. ISL-108]RKN67886.1 copper resistance protein CopC [Microbacterium sp. CGR2]
MTSHPVRSIRLAALTTTTAVATAAAVAFLAAAPASAHDNLLDTVPAAGETVTTVETVSLTFSGELIDFDETSFAQVRGPDGLYYETSCSTVEINTLNTPVALGEPGTYTVAWNALSSDGHPISESYEFDYAPTPGAASTLGWNVPACRSDEERVQPGAAPTTAPSESANVSPIPTPADTSTGAPDDTGEGAAALIVAGGVIVTALVAAVVWFRRRGRSVR